MWRLNNETSVSQSEGGITSSPLSKQMCLTEVTVTANELNFKLWIYMRGIKYGTTKRHYVIVPTSVATFHRL